jgi:hypothetical protein
MVSATVDHIVSITIFLAALLLFVNLFGQNIQTAILYQEHRATATKCSDLLDTMLLNPGSPNNWGQSNVAPSSFGLQDPDFAQYEISPFSPLRLDPASGNHVRYDKTSPDTDYLTITPGDNSLCMPVSSIVNYSSTLKLLGINNTYGFQLTLTPVISASITDDYDCPEHCLRLNVTLTGTGFPLAGASVNYCLLKVHLPTIEAEYPFYTLHNGTITADSKGFASVKFSDTTEINQIYAFVIYAHLGGIVGVGYHEHITSSDEYVVPMVEDLSTQKILLVHNFDLNNSGPSASGLKYNATFVVFTEDFAMREMPLDSPNTTGTVTSGIGNPYINVTIPTFTAGILMVTYQQSGDLTKGGIVLMPWGINSLAFPVIFGEDPQQQEWVATDLRQVTINHVTYQAKLSLWSLSGKQVVG